MTKVKLTNLNRQFNQEIEKYAHEEEIQALDMIFSLAQIETYEHTMDNSSLDSSFGLMLHKLRKNGYAFLGIGKAPWVHQGRDMAIVFEDSYDFKKYWYHVSSSAVEWWQEQVAIYLGKDI